MKSIFRNGDPFEITKSAISLDPILMVSLMIQGPRSDE